MSDRRKGQTHGVRCYEWGPAHYECALAEIRDLQKAAPAEGPCNCVPPAQCHRCPPADVGRPVRLHRSGGGTPAVHCVLTECAHPGKCATACFAHEQSTGYA